MQVSGNQIDIESLSLLANDIKNTEPSGRVIVDLLNYSEPVFIQNGDELIIPEKTNNVYIFGEVNNTGALEYIAGADIDFYIEKASGLKDTANEKSIYLNITYGLFKLLHGKLELSYRSRIIYKEKVHIRGFGQL